MKHLLTIIIILIINIANAQTNEWIGGNGIWNNNSNWSQGHLPNAFERVIIC